MKTSYKTIRPGKWWYDTDGKLIQAHGGSIIEAEGKYWWYGENKEGITGDALGEPCPYWHHGVKLYSSTDLYNWTDEGFCVAESDDKENPFHPENLMDRPHVLYNEKTGKYVLWAKTVCGRDFDKCFFSVCVGDSLKNMRFVKKIYPHNHNVGDFDMFVHNGKGYVVYEKPHTEMIISELTEDFTDVAEKWSTHLHLKAPPYIREAPAVFKKDGKIYLLTSGTTGYYANPSIVYDITDLHGEWKDLGLACIDDKNNDSFHAQFASVFYVEKSDTYIALGDRWLTDLVFDKPDAQEEFYQLFFNGIPMSPQEELHESNTSLAKYVWLPIEFTKDGPRIRWVRTFTV